MRGSSPEGGLTLHKDERRRDKEKAVYEAVLSLLESGREFSELKVQQIADAAGIGKGTVYEYFASKEEILQGTVEYSLTQEVQRAADDFYRCATLDELIDGMCGYLRELCGNRAAIYRILVRTVLRSRSAPDCSGMQSRRRQMAERLARMVTRLQAAGQVDPALEVDYCCYVLTSASLSCAALLGGPDDIPEEQAERVLAHTAQMLRRSLAPQSPEKR